METGTWVREGLRAIAGGVFAVGLAITNLPLLAMSLVALALAPVPFLGLALLPWVTNLVRMRANLERRLAARAGIAIARPYEAPPPRALPGGWKRFRWIATDPATWRDLAWLVPGALVGFVLGLIAVVIPLYGLEGISLLPLWLYLSVDWYGYGVFWPIANFSEAMLSMPQGVLFLALGLGAAPWLLEVNAQFAKLFLAPTKAANLRLRVTQLTATRADTVDAQAAELRRIERDLHDGAQQRLLSLAMNLGMAREAITEPSPEADAIVAAHDEALAALTELRQFVRGLHPAVLNDRGLDAAISGLAARAKIPIDVTVQVQPRCPPSIEAVAYFIVSEALTNVAKHSEALIAAVSVTRQGSKLHIVVTDDGHGGATAKPGGGIAGLIQRTGSVDGRFSLSSPRGGPTVIKVVLPCG